MTGYLCNLFLFSGTTVFLTTLDMHEAEELCNRVAFLNYGEICELGNPDELKLKHAKDEIVILSTTDQCIRTRKNIQIFNKD